jgi:hypothetical protein
VIYKNELNKNHEARQANLPAKNLACRWRSCNWPHELRADFGSTAGLHGNLSGQLLGL